MKQGVHEILPISLQVAVIYAGTNGYLDDIPVSDILSFESRLFDTLKGDTSGYMRLLNENRALTDDVKAALDRILKQLKGL